VIEAARRERCPMFMCSVHVRGRVTATWLPSRSHIVEGRVDHDAIAIGGRIESNSNSTIAAPQSPWRIYPASGKFRHRRRFKSLPYVLIPGQSPDNSRQHHTRADQRALCGLGYLLVREKRAETFARAIEGRPLRCSSPASFVFHIYGLDWLTAIWANGNPVRYRIVGIL